MRTILDIFVPRFNKLRGQRVAYVRLWATTCEILWVTNTQHSSFYPPPKMTSPCQGSDLSSFGR